MFTYKHLHKVTWFSRWSNMAQINTQNDQSDMQTVQTLCDKRMFPFTFYKRHYYSFPAKSDFSLTLKVQKFTVW